MRDAPRPHPRSSGADAHREVHGIRPANSPTVGLGMISSAEPNLPPDGTQRRWTRSGTGIRSNDGRTRCRGNRRRREFARRHCSKDRTIPHPWHDCPQSQPLRAWQVVQRMGLATAVPARQRINAGRKRTGTCGWANPNRETGELEHEKTSWRAWRHPFQTGEGPFSRKSASSACGTRLGRSPGYLGDRTRTFSTAKGALLPMKTQLPGRKGTFQSSMGRFPVEKGVFSVEKGCFHRSPSAFSGKKCSSTLRMGCRGVH